MADYHQENVLKQAVESFSETIALKLSQLRRYVPKNTNPALTGDFVEDLVRGFIQDWITPQQLLNGTFYSAASEAAADRPLQIDGIVYDPRRGPVTLREGGVVIVHPAFCSGVIEIKTSLSKTIMDFEDRLRLISGRHMQHRVAKCVMGVVLADKDPEGISRIPTAKPGEHIAAYNYAVVGWCPIFVLFKEENDEYQPHKPAIEAMIRAIYLNLELTENFL